jgi:hypothetical protein
MLSVAAEQLVGALAGEGDGDVLRGHLGERDEAERREVGERLVEVPDERSSEIVSSANESSSSWWFAPSSLATKRASASSLLRRPPEADGERVHRPVHLLRHQATIKLESRPPLSIAPSGTSLISRIRTEFSSSASSRSLHSSTFPPRSSVGSG